jgi:hypothetical protein
MTQDGIPIEPHPELEVTDGWYRLKAQVDESLARAVRKGTLRVGRKIGIAGARVLIVFPTCISQPTDYAFNSFHQSGRIQWRFWTHTTPHDWLYPGILHIWHHGIQS